MRKKVLFVLVMLVISSFAGVKRDYKKALESNTITNFEGFIRKYPDNEYLKDVSLRLETLYYNEAMNADSVVLYNEYLNKYPSGKFKNEALKEIEKLDYRWSSQQNTIEAFNSYLKKHPNGLHKIKIMMKIETLDYSQAKLVNTIVAFKTYLNKYPNGIYKKEASNKIEKLEYNQAELANSKNSYKSYLNKYPNGSYKKEAMTKIETFDYNQVNLTNSEEAYKIYLNKYPNGIYKNNVIAKLINNMLKSIKDISVVKDAVYKDNELAIIISIPLSSISFHEISGSSVNFINSTKVKAYKTVIPSHNNMVSEVNLLKPHGALVIYDHEPILNIPKHLIVKLNQTHYIVDGSGKLRGIYDRRGFWVKNNANYELYKPKGSTITISSKQKDPDVGVLHTTEDQKNIVIPFIFNDMAGVLTSDRICIFDQNYDL